MTLWHDQAGGKYYVFVSDSDGNGSVRQFELFDDGGQIGGTLRREWNVGSLTEGLADTPTVDDFEFKAGKGDDPAGWDGDPKPVSVTVRPARSTLPLKN